MRDMVTVRDILARFGKLPDVQKAMVNVGVAPPPSIATMSAWQIVGRIPSWWHRRLLNAAAAVGVPLTADELADAADRKNDRSSAAEETAA